MVKYPTSEAAGPLFYFVFIPTYHFGFPYGAATPFGWIYVPFISFWLPPSAILTVDSDLVDGVRCLFFGLYIP
ncbi:hypothetical protein B0T17DRAFT_545936 [Bombardia bombarda]|uniref:Uncharacterized protein n=1 Tax=Bombardia bombarda TaxID=252184 RepID=A0AA39W9R5_9PEZI|nr:hypothetical protein B0T17DRAFT_545936 [Bombardia bombarda]